ncbi:MULTISPECIES: DUF4259 domain-containing protein [unclassified Lentimonas]|uniref:DUF4259 domain-containing protein n=1 Tax=unclassified Lentimonas TaxID=2630993 RepID=UPI00132C0FF2|nr:Unannotated [Lentimonas sp. CC4]CAA6687024.1 Unannotated [Lentimonas sp. CC6]CAA6696730.1 Unannotated [Lentimonas sp. CC10]CAA6697335.1 Unannotated [Lentimonas sp. CC19]CAA7072252.1 Unannotated [Lentimonas sp. CC11]CAA7172007.1 Unannotated [Lentimonas sp. CC21]CAA7182930.1 Unannotated [Lentimonas sp. CC8]
MGAWGANAFENDTALDWISETGANIASIDKALEEVIAIRSGKEKGSFRRFLYSTSHNTKKACFRFRFTGQHSGKAHPQT